MITLSSRYAAAIALLTLLAVVPVVVHSSGRRDMDDCSDPGALGAALLIPGSRPDFDTRETLPGALRGDSRGVLEPRLSRRLPPLKFAVRRNFETAAITSQPGRAVVKKLDVQERELHVLERDGVRIPIHWVEELTRSVPTFAAYFYVYENRPVESPYRALLGSALRRLVQGSRPLTVFAVGGAAPNSLKEEARHQAEDWLSAAWDHYRNVCIRDEVIDESPGLR